MNVVEKLLARAAGREVVERGEIVECSVDVAVLLDIQFGDALGWETPLRIHDKDQIAVVMDHAVPAARLADAENGTRARQFVKQFGIEKFFDVGRHGICHQVIAEEGLAIPGQMLACTDSHTCAAGAFNCAARGLGPAEMLQVVCTGTTWHVVAPTIRYDLEGSMSAEISGKDIFLYIAGKYGSSINHNLEFGGPGLASVPINDRRTIATQGAEVNADFTIFEFDSVVESYLRPRAQREYEPAAPDDDAVYADRRVIPLEQIEPQVARPGTVIGNSLPVSKVEHVKLDQCFVGSCANGQLEDLAIVADVVKGRTVHPATRFIVTPASQAVYLEAVKLGYVEAIVDAGAVVTNSTCGACFGYHMGVLGPGEVGLTASTRNFKGRMGSADARIYMASPATVAASALTGHITNPSEVMDWASR